MHSKVEAEVHSKAEAEEVRSMVEAAAEEVLVAGSKVEAEEAEAEAAVPEWLRLLCSSAQ